jgi:hypothetical protein
MPTPLLPKKTTKLQPHLENLYQMWSTVNNVPQGGDYDMRGFYMGGLLGDPQAHTGIDPSDGLLHYSDKWKLPSHPSFSKESMYSTAEDDPEWIQPAPYKDGTWARLYRGGLLNVDLPQ